MSSSELGVNCDYYASSWEMLAKGKRLTRVGGCRVLVVVIGLCFCLLAGVGCRGGNEELPQANTAMPSDIDDEPGLSPTVIFTKEATPTLASIPTRVPTSLLAPSTADTTEPDRAAPNPNPSGVNDRVESILSQLTIRQKVGQLFLVFFEGPDLSPELRRMICDYNVGGLVLFDSSGNIVSLPQITTLIKDAQMAATTECLGIPLIVAVDQEGGSVSRLREGVAVAPSQMALGATHSVDLVRAVYSATAEQLQALGFNMNLAPVLDVNTNPLNPVIGTRSYGSSSEEVARLGSAAIVSMQARGIIATAKHFPGHGDTEEDSHWGLPVVSRSRDELWVRELLPFRVAIASGVDAVMTAHILVPSVDADPERPATLSSAMLTGLLRDKMGFSGIIVTDSMTMGALTGLMNTSEAAVLAINAGADMLAFGADWHHSPAEQIPVYDRLLDAVSSGEISEARLDESVRRILRVKAQRGILDWRGNSRLESSFENIGNEAQRLVAQEAAQRSITLVRDEKGLIPLHPGLPLALVTVSSAAVWQEAMATCPNATEILAVEADPGPISIDRVVAHAAQAGRVVVCTENARFFAGQSALVNALREYPTIVVSMSGPYELAAFGDMPTMLVAYDGTPSSIVAVARALCGQHAIVGELPVDLPGLSADWDRTPN